VIRNLLRPADGPEEDRVVNADFLLPVFGHHRAVFQVVVATPVEFVVLERYAVLARHGIKAAQALRNDFLAYPVTRNYCNLVSFHMFSVFKNTIAKSYDI